MDETTQNFLDVMANFPWPEEVKVAYRLYHDDSGCPLFYTMETPPGTYIEISREDFFLSSMDCRVVNGRIVHPVKNQATKLHPGNTGVACHPQDIAVVVDDDTPNIKWSIR